MSESLLVDTFLEKCLLSGILTGNLIFNNKTQRPIAGFTGFCSKHERAERKSTWVTGEIFGGFVMNNGCAAASHIEGIARDDGKLYFLEQVYHFPACEGDCFAYKMQVENMGTSPLVFRGEVVARRRHNGFRPVRVGNAIVHLNSHWLTEEVGANGTSTSHSLPYWNRSVRIEGEYVPHFWGDFLKEIETEGYAHPYMIEQRGRT